MLFQCNERSFGRRMPVRSSVTDKLKADADPKYTEHLSSKWEWVETYDGEREE